MGRKIQIGVIGGRQVSSDLLNDAEEIGRLIAIRKAVLICGGLGGVMAAACRGAMHVGGTTVGILPGSLSEDANPDVSIVIPTDMGVARNSIIIHSCDGVIAVGGKYGTLSEIAFALQKEIPVVSLKSWNVDENVIQANSPEEAVEKLFEKLGKKK